VIKPEPGLEQPQIHELDDEDESMVVKVEPGVDGVRQGVAVNGDGRAGNGLPEDGEEEEEEEEGELETAETTPAAEKASSGVMVMGESGLVLAASRRVSQLIPRTVAGILKPLDEITEEDQELMTTDEYQVSGTTTPGRTEAMEADRPQAYYEAVLEA
jgi:hypothetical protein